jgi:hypothetical protein
MDRRNITDKFSSLRKSILLRFGLIVAAVKFIPNISNISDYVQTYVFVRDNWMTLLNFLGTGWGTLATIGGGFCLVAFAVYRALRPLDKQLPSEIAASYERVELDLNNVEDHITFVFKIKNDTKHRIVLTGTDSGWLRMCTPIISPYLFGTYFVRISDPSRTVAPNNYGYVEVTRVLEAGLAFHLAFKNEHNEDVTLDFSDMRIGIRTNNKRPQFGIIRLPADTTLAVPNSPHYWAKYRDLYTRLNK